MLQDQQECKRISIQTLSLDPECRSKSTCTPSALTSRNRTRNFQQFLIEKDGYKVLSTLQSQKTPSKTDRCSRILVDKQTNNTYRHLSEQQVDLKDFYKLIITSHENSSLTSKTTRSQVLNKLLNTNNISYQPTLVGGNNQHVDKNVAKSYSSGEVQGFQTPKKILYGKSSQMEDKMGKKEQKLILSCSNTVLNENETQIQEEKIQFPSENTIDRNNRTSLGASSNINQVSKNDALGVVVQRMSKIFDFDSIKKSQELYALSRRKFSFSKGLSEEGNVQKEEQTEGIDSKGKRFSMRNNNNTSATNVQSQNMLQNSQLNTQTRRSSFIKQNLRQQQEYQAKVHHNQRYSVPSRPDAQAFGHKHFEIPQKVKVSQETQCEFSSQSCHEITLKNNEIEQNLAENTQMLEIQASYGKQTEKIEDILDISSLKENNILEHCSILKHNRVSEFYSLSQTKPICQSAHNQSLEATIAGNNNNNSNISMKILMRKPNTSSFSSPALSDRNKSLNQSEQLQQYAARDMLSNRRVVLSRLRLRNKTAEKYSSSQNQLLQIITQPLTLLSHSIATAETEPSCPPISTQTTCLSRTNQLIQTRSSSVNSKRMQSADTSSVFLQKSLSPKSFPAKKVDVYPLRRAPLKIMTLIRGLSWNAQQQQYAEQAKRIAGDNEQNTQEQQKQQQKLNKNEKITEKKTFYSDWNKFQLVQAAFNENRNSNANSKTPKQVF